MNNACTVCTEPYNRKNKKITCTSCDYDVCSKCVETYFQTSKASPQCMQCHRPWNHQFIIENLGNASYKRINNIQKELLYNEQKSLFPHTQGYVSLMNQYNANNDKVKDLRQQLNNLKTQIDDIYYENARITNIKNRIERNFLANHNLTDNGGPFVDSAKKTQKTYIQACGIPECKGFINTNGVCGMCSTVFCTKCMVVKNDNHECNPDTVASLDLIKKDSKNCPKCSCLINRICGCPDMFCTSCHTTFNWNTLKIDLNGNSNPMYYRWLRGGANITDNANDNCHIVTMSRVFSSANYKKQSKHFQTFLSKALQSLDHSNRYGNFYNYNTVIRIDNNVDYETLTLQTRTKFMCNKITEKNYKIQLMKIHKAKEYKNNINEIRNMINLYRIDMMRSIVLSENFDANTCIQEYVGFSEYINNCVNHLKTVFYNHKSTTNDANTGFISVPSQILNRNQT